MLKTMRLKGRMAKMFGQVHQFHVADLRELLRAMCSQVPGFKKYVSNAHLNGVRFAFFSGKDNIGLQEFDMSSAATEFEMEPVLEGSKRGGTLQIIIGAVAIVAAFFTAGGSLALYGAALGTTTATGLAVTALTSMGISMLLGGVVQMLTPQPKLNVVAFDGPTTSGLAWNAIPASLQVAITQKILNDFANVARGRILDFQNWQKIYSDAQSVTVTRPDRTTFTGPSWGYMANQYAGKMDKSQNLNDVANKTTALNNLGALPLSGGTLTGGLIGTTIVAKRGVSSTSNGVDMGQQGTHLVWNEDGSTGKGSIVVNRGSGTGGFNIRIVNASNTVENANFQFTVDGLMYAPNGAFSVGGRVRAFSAVNSTYLEVKVDGAAKGINFFDSDKTLKEDIKDADESMALDIIRKIRPVAYKFKDINFTYQSPDPVSGEMFNAEGKQAGSSHKYGVIAQEFEELLPEGVITNSDGKKSLDPLEQIGLLLTVCHAQQKMIDDQSEIIKAMGIRLKDLDGLDG